MIKGKTADREELAKGKFKEGNKPLSSNFCIFAHHKKES